MPIPILYTHLHTHAETHACAHTHTMHTYTRADMHIDTHTHTHVHVYTHRYKRRRSYPHAHTHAHTHVHTHAHTFIHTHMQELAKITKAKLEKIVRSPSGTLMGHFGSRTPDEKCPINVPSFFRIARPPPGKWDINFERPLMKLWHFFFFLPRHTRPLSSTADR